MRPLPHTRTELAGFIDHTLLRPEATAADVDRLCDECLKYGFHAACVNPIWVARCAERLTGGGVVVVSVAGFPLGAGTPEAKAYEALVGVDAGAGEIDMVANLGALRASDVAHVTHDIEAVVETVKTTGTPITLKVILETRILTNEQIILGCRCAAAAGADFVKTSTGFHLAGGATTEHVTLLRQHAAPLKVKASGGIRDLPTAKAMIAAGADRLGTTASVAIIADLPA